MLRARQEIKWSRYRKPTSDELDQAAADGDSWWLCSECVADGSVWLGRDDGLLWHDEWHNEEFAESEPQADDE